MRKLDARDREAGETEERGPGRQHSQIAVHQQRLAVAIRRERASVALGLRVQGDGGAQALDLGLADELCGPFGGRRIAEPHEELGGGLTGDDVGSGLAIGDVELSEGLEGDRYAGAKFPTFGHEVAQTLDRRQRRQLVDDLPDVGAAIGASLKDRAGCSVEPCRDDRGAQVAVAARAAEEHERLGSESPVERGDELVERERVGVTGHGGEGVDTARRDAVHEHNRCGCLIAAGREDGRGRRAPHDRAQPFKVIFAYVPAAAVEKVGEIVERAPGRRQMVEEMSEQQTGLVPPERGLASVSGLGKQDRGNAVGVGERGDVVDQPPAGRATIPAVEDHVAACWIIKSGDVAAIRIVEERRFPAFGDLTDEPEQEAGLASPGCANREQMAVLDPSR
jgi:hypothetical protein